LADLLEAQGKIADAENMRAKAAELTGGKMPQPAVLNTALGCCCPV